MGKIEKYDLTSKMFKKHAYFLLALHRLNNKTMKEIAKEVGVHYIYLDNIVKFFEDAGIVKKTKSGSDGRKYVISLTKYGRDIVNLLVGVQKALETGEVIKDPRKDEEGVIVIYMEDLRKAVSKKGGKKWQTKEK